MATTCYKPLDAAYMPGYTKLINISYRVNASCPCQLPVAICELSVARCIASIPRSQMPVASCQLSDALPDKLPVARCKLLVASCQMPDASCPMPDAKCMKIFCTNHRNIILAAQHRIVKRSLCSTSRPLKGDDDLARIQSVTSLVQAIE